MTPGRAAMVMLAALFAAAPTLAQPPADPINALLQRPLARDADPEEPDTAAQGRRVEPDPVAPVRETARRRPALTVPVQIGETGKSPDAPPTTADLAYDNRIRASMASAQGFQGPMEGGWSLLAGGRELYVLQLTDRNGALEGAWRDPRRRGVPSASGFIDRAERAGDDLTLSLASGAVAILHAAQGGWSGELSEGGAAQKVILRRRSP